VVAYDREGVLTALACVRGGARGDRQIGRMPDAGGWLISPGTAAIFALTPASGMLYVLAAR
jgi:hypothetical protein